LGTRISRRSFLKKSAIALGAVAVCNVDAVGGADQVGGLNTLPGELKEKTMPHVIVKLYPGRSEQQKIRLAEQIVKDVVEIIKCDESSVSVAIEEIKSSDWAEKVYKPDIIDKADTLYKKPGYRM
jgi:4-oxalocrotonate tautomerase